MTESDKPWITPLLKSLIHQRFDAYRRRDYAFYEHLKKKVKVEIDKAKAKWINKLKKTKIGFWALKKQMNNPKAQTNCALQNLIAQYETTTEAANEINNELSALYTPSTLGISSVRENTAESWDISIDTEEVHKILSRLNTRKAAGSDGLSPFLLKLSSDFLAEPITHLISLSVESGKVPDVWKEANIIPIPKGNPANVTNLRPISLLPIVAKILEKLVLKSVKNLLLSMYGPNQHGFRPGHSTLTSHLTMQDQITSFFDDRTIRGVIMLSFDMSRAFDRIPHENLVKRLIEAGLPSEFISWCTSYLSNRTQKVVLRNAYYSSEKSVTSGVPQGSILGPYLFCSYIGTLSKALSTSTMYKYADDVVIISPFTTSDEVTGIVEKEIRNISLWCETNGLVLNNSKTKLMIMDKRRGDSMPPPPTPLPISEKLTVLGVVFHYSMKWKAHVHNVAKRAFQRVYLIKTLKRMPNITKEDLFIVYDHLIRSILEYNAPLFVGISKREDVLLEEVQRRCHRIICGEACNQNCLQTLSERRKSHAMKLFERSIKEESHPLHKLMPHTLIHSGKLSVPYCRTQCRQSSFVPFCTLLLNDS